MNDSTMKSIAVLQQRQRERLSQRATDLLQRYPRTSEHELRSLIMDMRSALVDIDVSMVMSVDHERYVIRELYEAVTGALRDIEVVLGRAGCPQGVQMTEWLYEQLADREAARDMLMDARGELDMLREALGVEYEPHQNLFERMLEAARATGKTLKGD